MTRGRRDMPGRLPGPPYRIPSYWNPAFWTGGAPFGGSWTVDHLTADAIVAYVDDELSPAARSRATEHLSRCGDCVREVSAQLQARSALRSAASPALPGSLLDALRAIPRDVELPPAPRGLAVGPDGSVVARLRDPEPPGAPGRESGGVWLRLGASAAAGVALGALLAAMMPVQAGPIPGTANSEPLDARFQIAPAEQVQSPRLEDVRRATPDAPSTPGAPSTTPSAQPPVR